MFSPSSVRNGKTYYHSKCKSCRAAHIQSDRVVNLKNAMKSVSRVMEDVLGENEKLKTVIAQNKDYFGDSISAKQSDEIKVFIGVLNAIDKFSKTSSRTPLTDMKNFSSQIFNVLDAPKGRTVDVAVGAEEFTSPESENYLPDEIAEAFDDLDGGMF